MAKTLYIATLSNGTQATRSSDRPYTHAVQLEETMVYLELLVARATARLDTETAQFAEYASLLADPAAEIAAAEAKMAELRAAGVATPMAVLRAHMNTPAMSACYQRMNVAGAEHQLAAARARLAAGPRVLCLGFSMSAANASKMAAAKGRHYQACAITTIQVAPAPSRRAA
jgi:hypothetical protein